MQCSATASQNCQSLSGLVLLRNARVAPDEGAAILLSPQHPQPWADAIGNLLDEDTCRTCPAGYETRYAACSAGGTGLKVGLPCLSDADCDGAACDSAAASVEATACAPCGAGQSDADSTSSSAWYRAPGRS